MPYDGLTIARHFIDLAEQSGEKLTPLKVQKLVYFAHGWHLALTGKPLLNEVIQAWSFGPVVRSVYNAFRGLAGGEIDAEALRGLRRVPLLRDLTDAEAAHARELVAQVWEEYGGLTAIQLANLAHEPGSPWDVVNQRYGGEIPKFATVADELIKAHFDALAAEGEEAEAKAGAA